MNVQTYKFFFWVADEKRFLEWLNNFFFIFSLSMRSWNVYRRWKMIAFESEFWFFFNGDKWNLSMKCNWMLFLICCFAWIFGYHLKWPKAVKTKVQKTDVQIQTSNQNHPPASAKWWKTLPFTMASPMGPIPLNISTNVDNFFLCTPISPVQLSEFSPNDYFAISFFLPFLWIIFFVSFFIISLHGMWKKCCWS